MDVWGVKVKVNRGQKSIGAGQLDARLFLKLIAVL